MAASTITFRVPSDLIGPLKNAASNTSNSAVIVDALRVYLDQPVSSAEARLNALLGKLEIVAESLNTESVTKKPAPATEVKDAGYDAAAIAKIIRGITEKSTDRKVNVAIATHLNELGFTTSKGGNWSRADVSNFKLRVMSRI